MVLTDPLWLTALATTLVTRCASLVWAVPGSPEGKPRAAEWGLAFLSDINMYFCTKRKSSIG